MRIIAKATIKLFVKKHPELETGAKIWITKTQKALWEKPSDIFETFPKARTIGDNRVIFNLMNNNFRLIAKVNYDRKSLFVVFIGTHEEYDAIDPLSVWNY